MKISNLRLEPYKISHLYEIHLRDFEVTHLIKEELIGLSSIHGAQAMTMYDNKNRIIAILGFFPLWQGVIHVYVVPSKFTVEMPIDYIYAVRRRLRGLEETYKPHRMQTWSNADETTDRWMKALGFKCEGTLRQFTYDKLDYRMWSRIINDGK